MTRIESTSSTAWLCGALLLSALLPAQANWTLRSPAMSPSARYFHAMECDSTGGVVLFGGSIGSGGLSDTWQWDGSNWTQRNTSPSPPARLSHSMVYDAARARVVLFGGGSGGSYSDTWEWDGASWSQRSPVTSPSARYQHKMAYDSARGRVVLFGGSQGVPRLSDTWEWDGTNWTQRNPATSPSDRSWHAMACDATRGRVVLFGGYGVGGQLGDTWEWDGTNWTQSFPAASPGARATHAMTYDSQSGRVVLFAGRNSVAISIADTWEWDGTNWSQLGPATSPPGRSNHALTYDGGRGRLMVFGGSVNSTGFLFADTWEYGVPNPAIYTPLGPGCVGSAGVPTNTASALPRIGQTMTVNLSNLPPPELAFFAIGTSRTTSALGPLPLDLTGLGAPGCIGRVSIDAVQLLLGTGGSALFTLAIPGDPSFLGMQFFTQALVMDPGHNVLGLVVSDAAVMTIGS